MSRLFSGGKKRSSKNVFEVEMKNSRPAMSWNKFSMWIGVAVVGCVLTAVVTQWALDQVTQRMLYNNPDFAIRHLDIDVNGTLPQAEVMRWSGVRLGQNLFQVDLQQVKDNLMRVPYIGDVTVECRMPDTLSIHVEERQPVAVLVPKSRKGYRLAQSVYYLDASSVVMKPKVGERLKPLPVLTGIDSEKVAEGLRLDDAGVNAALNLLRLAELSPARQNLDLTEIDVGSPGLLHVRTRDHGWIRFRDDSLNQQLQRLEVIYEFAQRENKVVSTVDLTPERNVPVTFF